ncbi:uncharacterized protein NPIL_573841 [Nephila pilipes]|uniref:Uncharacterized protein n=1 Tax=Nephila pilipes TaxID=299642 RepID=A0A8X6U164_NEPPI|nr:uncharacterized protein NPIL_573841 [Nephila pilipes]
MVNIQTADIMSDYFSTYSRNVRVVAWILRYIHNISNVNKLRGNLVHEEFKKAENLVFKSMQLRSFQDEKFLAKMQAFKDEEGLLRIRTKLVDSDEKEDFKFPVLLPANDVVVKLIREEHKKAMHEEERLRKEHFISLSVWWLLQRHYIPTTSPCNYCGSKKFIVDKKAEFPDGFCWTCTNKSCSAQTSIKRTEFFGRFKLYSLKELLLLTYHWVCQSSLEDIMKDVDMDSEKIWYYFKALQELCHQIMIRKGKMGFASECKVEAAVMKVTDVFILGALDRKTRYVRFEAITDNEGRCSSRHINLLKNWINRKAILITENKMDDILMSHLTTVGADLKITDKESEEPHILNITEFMLKNLTAIFGGIDQAALKFNIIQGFLYELQWRVKFGSSYEVAFFNIFNHMKGMNEEKGKATVQYRRGDFPITLNASELNSSNNRWTSLPDDNIIDSSSAEDTKYTVSKETKSYAKNVAYRELQEVALLKGENPAFSIYFHDVPEVHGGIANITPKSLLAVKIRCEDPSKDTDMYRTNAICLVGNQATFRGELGSCKPFELLNNMKQCAEILSMPDKLINLYWTDTIPVVLGISSVKEDTKVSCPELVYCTTLRFLADMLCPESSTD